jgi:geranylgeranyl diphosphate synthase type I
VTLDAGFVARVDARLSAVMGAERARWSAVDAALEPLLAEAERLVASGGKRLRPRFCRWGWIAAGGDPGAVEPERIGAALELLHVGALLHDDVIDAAETRRGASAAHRTFAAEHARAGWAGETRRFGEGAAVLLGDIVFVMADGCLGSTTDEVRQLWHEMRLEVNVGQYLDLLGGARRERDPSSTRRICRYKSAKYTVERPLQLGAAAAGATDELLGVLSGYGVPLGEAFQMRDDVLGAFGDEIATGKPVGGDFVEGKPTPMLALAWQAADNVQRRVLHSVGDPDLSASAVADIRRVVVETGALAETERLIASLRDEAVAALDDPHVHDGVRVALVALADEVTIRRT